MWLCQQLIDTTPRGPSNVVTSAKSNCTQRHGHGDPVALKMGPIDCPESQKGNLMYVCPCIIYEIDERYPLDAVIYLLL